MKSTYVFDEVQVSKDTNHIDEENKNESLAKFQL
jgi:hypothetical protein